MEIQQHDGVVVEAAGISTGLRQALNGGGEVLGRVLGNVAEIQNFPTCHQDLSMERPSMRGRRVHLHTLVDRYAEAFKRTGLMESYSS